MSARRLLLCLVMAIAGLAASAQQDTIVWFVNFYPGSDIYELEGHSALVVDIDGQQPVAFNYGVFDFNSPNFVYRFVKGETDYMAVAWPWDLYRQSFVHAGRRTVMHELNLNSEQKRRLLDFLVENVQPQNATYRYNYVKDNCATRPLRAVEIALGDSIMLGEAPAELRAATPTFRNIMRHWHESYPWYQFGIDLALGGGIDYPLSRREIAFAPIELDAMLADATVGGRPLVKDVTIAVDAPSAVAAPTPWYLSPLFVCWAIFALALLVSFLRKPVAARCFDAVYFTVAGLAGCIIAFLIFISTHEATSPNWLILWLNPFALLVPVLIWSRRTRAVLRYYYIAQLAAIAVMAIAWPFIAQSANAAFLPLILTTVLRCVIPLKSRVE